MVCRGVDRLKCKFIDNLHFVKTVYLLQKNGVYAFNGRWKRFYAKETEGRFAYLSVAQRDRTLFYFHKPALKNITRGETTWNSMLFWLISWFPRKSDKPYRPSKCMDKKCDSLFIFCKSQNLKCGLEPSGEHGAYFKMQVAFWDL